MSMKLMPREHGRRSIPADEDKCNVYKNEVLHLMKFKLMTLLLNSD